MQHASIFRSDSTDDRISPSRAPIHLTLLDIFPSLPRSRPIFYLDFVWPPCCNDVPALRHKEEDGPGEDPELQDNAGPVDVFVVLEAVERMGGDNGHGAWVERECDGDMAPVVCGPDIRANIVNNSLLVTHLDSATQGEAIRYEHTSVLGQSRKFVEGLTILVSSC